MPLLCTYEWMSHVLVCLDRMTDVWCTNQFVNNNVAPGEGDKIQSGRRSLLLLMTCHQASRNLYFVKKIGKKNRQKKVALLYFIFTRHFVISMLLLILVDFFFLKHANIDGNIKFLYHICIQAWSLRLFVQTWHALPSYCIPLWNEHQNILTLPSNLFCARLKVKSTSCRSAEG